MSHKVRLVALPANFILNPGLQDLSGLLTLFCEAQLTSSGVC